MMRRQRLSQTLSHAAMLVVLVAGLMLPGAATLHAQSVQNDTPQLPPFLQDWTNTGLIVTTDDWSGVPGIIGYRGDGLATTGADPQTVLADGTATPVDVNANQANPNTYTSGGVTEFEGAYLVVAMQGSGTADAPFILFNLDTTGNSNLQVAYNVRDIDGSTDNAIQQVALHYRVGNSGDFVNLPGGYIPDATTGPSLADLVTPVSVTLPPDCNNQPLVQVRVMTCDATGSDEWVGIDDISVTGQAGDLAPSIVTTDPLDGAVDVAVDANLAVTFSEPVTLDSSWYDITCTLSGVHTAVVSGGPETYALDPDSDFANGETCTATVYAAAVHDQDGDDPPDGMDADYVWDFQVVALGDQAPTVASTDPQAGATGVALDANLSVTFSEEVTVDAGWFSVLCADSGPHSATHTGGPLTFAIDPDTDFVGGESCTVTILGSAIHDVDANDPPDAMEADYEWSFETAVPLPPIIINELDADQVSTDTSEFIELFDGGVGLTPLDGLVVVFYNGSNDLSYRAEDLDGYSTDANGYFVLGNALVPGVDKVFPNDSLQNGQDAVALYVGSASDFPANTPVTTANLVDAIVYDTSDADDPGLLVLLNVGQPQVDENGGGSGTTHSNQRCPNGTGGPRNTFTYLQDAPTADGPNDCYIPPPEQCGDPYTFIYDIQGSGMDSPLVGTEVALEGVVVGDFQNNATPDNGDLNGFHVQDPAGDGLAATSDGVFVYYSANTVDVARGDAVRVRGVVSEYNGMTEVSATQVWICSSGNSITPTPISLPQVAVAEYEPYEGMLVTFPDTLYISEYFNFDRYNEMVLTDERQNTPTAVYEPGSPEQAALAAQNALKRITLDDGRTVQNPDPAIHPNGAVFDMGNLFRGGDTLTDVTGVLDYSFSLYRIQPVQGASYTPVNVRPPAPVDVGGRLRVASFNLLNYFTTIDQGPGYWICGPAGDLECRGADTAEEFIRQRDKIISALAGMSPDVAGLVEMENHPADVPTADLVSGLNAVLGAGTYDYIATGAIGTDAIRAAIIYKPASVTPLGAFAVLDSSVDPRFLDTKNRPVLAQSFQENGTGEVFTVAVNHLKSKGSDCNDVGDPDLGDGAGNCNLTRTSAAEALVDWLAADPTGSGDGDSLILGDLNSYDKEDPIDVLLAGGYTDLEGYFHGEYAYSYLYDGQLGYLDYVMPNTSLFGQVTGATVWHINADESDLINYDMDYKLPAQDALYAPDAYRSGDHDPIIVGLSLCEPVQGAEFMWDPLEPQAGQEVFFMGWAEGSEPLTYAWDLGDGSQATGATAFHTYAAPGDYLVTLTVANGCGQQVVQHTVSVTALGTMHVQWIKMRYFDRDLGRYVVGSQARILDAAGVPVIGATVSAEWTAPNGATKTQVRPANLNGLAVFKAQTRRVGLWQLCITNVELAGWVYDPDANLETCDSITVP